VARTILKMAPQHAAVAIVLRGRRAPTAMSEQDWIYFVTSRLQVGNNSVTAYDDEKTLRAEIEVALSN
jgi:hypothetical protein